MGGVVLADPGRSSGVRRALGVLRFLGVLYLFFICIELFGVSFKLFGVEHARDALRVADNPMVGLLLGILGTSLVQSSSTSSSIIVGMVGTGVLSVPQAIPMVMGANIGTTITNTIVSLGHLRRREEFNRAFQGAVVHDFFNICSVIVLLPIELLFRPIERTATFITESLLGFEGLTFTSPLKAIVTPITSRLVSAGRDLLASEIVLAIILAVLSLTLLMFALTQMVRIMRGALARQMEGLVDRFLFKNRKRAFTVGILLTVAVQSSSVATSLVIPLIGAGIVSLEKAYPYMVGSNIGTTVTAFLASFVTGNPMAVTIAFCHLIFNLLGTLIFLPLARIPITLARIFGELAGRQRWAAVIYVLLLFFGLPALFVLL